MKSRLLLLLVVIGLCSSLAAAEQAAYPRISLVGPGAGKTPVNRDQFIILVVEGPYISHEANPLPEKGAVEYINDLLKAKKVSYLAVYTREGVKYGDVVKAIDLLRKTDATEIGVSMIEAPAGREL
ncbi:hypothetical protein [Opitutus terrae]|uniref:Uncharacterized protein n=1 Tax=Opitutus terrae (strain DSM 11246 / JCM 15787 / PB90-1) TaxID=452637 RepID=B1ZWD3_OPITP|nr:hypothetical protein [Opitutus terrae]ACB76885.1 hypothetical protein Oter_3608 [Opitutus terrae PB90-1]